VNKGKLYMMVVTMDLDQEPIPHESRFWCFYLIKLCHISWMLM